MSGARFPPELTGGLSECFPVQDVAKFLATKGFEPEEYVALKQNELDTLRDALHEFLETDLKDFSARLYSDLTTLTQQWAWERRKDLLVRYLGFPFWDVLLFPIQSVAQAGERDAVEVIRMSPIDAELLDVPGGGEKLDGVGFAHFRGFFERKYRENDYLWGRLDGAERMIGIVLGTDHPDYRTWCGRAFVAILDEEEPALRLVSPLVADLRRQAQALAQARDGGSGG
jgi:hypothetical protein